MWQILDLQTQKQLLTRMRAHIITERQQKMAAVLAFRTRYLTVVLEDLYDPRNTSAILRSCDCFGVQEVHAIEKRNAFPQYGGYAAAGAERWVSVHRYNAANGQGTTDCLQELKEAGYFIVATTLRESAPAASPKQVVSLHTLPLNQKIALCYGNEEVGLSDEAHHLADAFVQLPMFGFTQSFNISVTVALSLHTLTQRLHQSQLKWRLTEADQIAVELEWLVNSMLNGEQVLNHHLDNLVAKRNEANVKK